MCTGIACVICSRTGLAQARKRLCSCHTGCTQAFPLTLCHDARDGLEHMGPGTLIPAVADTLLPKVQQPKLHRPFCLASASAREGSRAVRAVPVKVFVIGKSTGGASDEYAGFTATLSTGCQLSSPEILVKQRLSPKMSGPGRFSGTPNSTWFGSKRTQRQHRAQLWPNGQKGSNSSGF